MGHVVQDVKRLNLLLVGVPNQEAMLSVSDGVVKGPDTLMGDDGTASFMEGHGLYLEGMVKVVFFSYVDSPPNKPLHKGGSFAVKDRSLISTIMGAL
jgi:hypothetical protein